MSDEVLVRVDNVSKKFCKSLKRSLWYGMCDTARELNPFGLSASTSCENPDALPELRNDEFWAVKNVSFELKRGECLGLIGHNGAGKSTLLKMLNGLIKPDTGRIEMRGRIGALIELGAGFNPILTGRENIYNKGAILGFTKKEIDSKFDEIVDFAEIEEFIDMPVQNYSSGMKVRLGFAVSAMMEPDVLIIDEVLAVGDLGFQMKCLNRIYEMRQNCCCMVVSHSMPMIGRLADCACLINKGGVHSIGSDVGHVIESYHNLFSTESSSLTGSGKAQLLSMEIFNEKNTQVEAGSNFEFGEMIKLKLEIEIEESIPLFSVGISFCDMTLRAVAASYSACDEQIWNNRKTNRIEVKVPLYFATGRYSINVGVLGYRGEESDGEFLATYWNFTHIVIKSKALHTDVAVRIESEWKAN